MPLNPEIRTILDAIATGGGYELGTGTVLQDREAMAQLGGATQQAAVDLHRVEDFEIPGAAGPLPARGYWPSDTPGLPIVLFWHGGGWQMGDVDSVDRPVRAIADRAGVIVISTTHRLAPEHPYPAAVEDGFAALQWVSANAERLGGRADHVVIAGESSGGNVAGAVAVMARDAGGPPVAHQLLITPTVDADLTRPSCIAYGEDHLLTTKMMHLVWRRYLGPELSADLDAARYDRVPHRAALLRTSDLAGLAPATVIACECDPHHDENVAYAERLQQAGVPTRLADFPGLTHGALNLAGVVPAAREYADAVADLFAEATAQRTA
ncbi:MAG TPA: alpha/beta hydrolase [Baekduia sp.]|jgi:acetyl esterase